MGIAAHGRHTGVAPGRHGHIAATGVGTVPRSGTGERRAGGARGPIPPSPGVARLPGRAGGQLPALPGRLMSSRSNKGRPHRTRDFQRQRTLKPSRCQPMTVRGSTISNTCCQPDHQRCSRIHNHQHTTYSPANSRHLNRAGLRLAETEKSRGVRAGVGAKIVATNESVIA
jgi:hypothetical protein